MNIASLVYLAWKFQPTQVLLCKDAHFINLLWPCKWLNFICDLASHWTLFVCDLANDWTLLLTIQSQGCHWDVKRFINMHKVMTFMVFLLLIINIKFPKGKKFQFVFGQALKTCHIPFEILCSHNNVICQIFIAFIKLTHRV